jgi:hypothetical protein
MGRNRFTCAYARVSDYKGGRDDSEYLALLRQANEFVSKESEGGARKREAPKRPLGCLAFTDHNSVEGFRKYRDLYHETLSLRNSLRGRDPANAFLEKLEEDLKVWESVRVLMAVEIKADPGIDLLIVFHESIKPEQAVAFLETAYGRPYGEFAGNPTPVTTRTLVDTLSLVCEQFGEKALVVAPHVDSSGGIYEALKDYGQARAGAFRHAALRALSFNRSETRERVRSLFGQPDYRRSDKVALIQSSDFHGQPGAAVGQPRTEVCVARGRATFSSIKEAFGHADRVRCSVDFVEREYRLLTKDRHVAKFASVAGEALFREEDFDRVAEAACAMLNSDGGIIELEAAVGPGVERRSYMEPLLAQLTDEVLVRLEPKPKRPPSRDLRLSAGRLRVLFFFPSSRYLRTIDGTVLVVKGSETRKASAAEIERVVTRNTRWRFGDRFETTLTDVSRKSILLSKMPQAIPLVLGCQDKLDFGPPAGIEVVEPKDADAHEDTLEEIEELRRKAGKITPFGDPAGNASLIVNADPARAEDHYFRFSAFRCNADAATAERCGCAKIESPTIAFVAGGNVQLVEPGYFASIPPVVLLRLRGDWEGRAYALLSWFKSSFFVWHCAVHLGDPDTFFQLHLRPQRLAFPRLSFAEIMQRLDAFARNMILDEKKFMEEINRLKRKGALDGELQEKERIKFNKAADRRCLDLDREIYSFLELTKSDSRLVADTLREIHMTDFGFSAEADQSSR